MTEKKATAAEQKSIVVVGGGISGITSAIEAAEAGQAAVIVEKNPYLGGRVAQMNQYFPKMCPPTCGLEINFQRIRKIPALRYYTQAEVEKVSGEAGELDVTVKVSPRYVNEKCTGCAKCVDVCPAERSNDFNYGMDKTKAVYLPHDAAFPFRYVIDMEACRGKECSLCAEACPYGAIELDMQERRVEVKAGAIVSATGWKPYDPAKIDTLGFGTSPNVITNVMMERLAAPNGPTQGKITRPSDGREAKRVVFVQCSGSRDRLHLPFCSSVCCLASLKQAGYVRSQYADAELTMFYIDVRAPGKLEDFFTRSRDENRINLIKGKVAKVTADEVSGDVTVEAEDIMGGGKTRVRADLVVLATGMQPVGGVPGVAYDENAFVLPEVGSARALSAGCAKRPADVAGSVQDATGTALKALQGMARS